MRTLKMANFAFLTLFILGVSTTARADDFYKGKTIRFIVGAPAGGGYDTYTRAIARHLDDKLIPFIINKRIEDPEVKDLPLFTDVIKGEDNLATYKSWAASYEFQRPLSFPPNTPKERLETLRKGLAATLRDPEFLVEAKKTKLDIDPVSGGEIEGYVKKIYSMSDKVKQNLSFLVRSAQKKK